MVNEHIEETKKYLKEKYGYPSEQKIGTMTYKTINQYLNVFVNLSDALVKCCELLELEDCENAIKIICEYCKNADPINMEIISNRLTRLEKEFSNKVFFSKKRFIKLIQELNEVADKKSFNSHCVINYFVEHLKIRAVSYNIKNNNRNIDRDGEFYWGRDKDRSEDLY